ncbi:hypothetical protein Tco_0318547, partial [Tanacetum coccineum]
PTIVAEDDEMLKEKEIDILMALISLSFKKIYKPTDNNLRISSNTIRENQDNNRRINRGTGHVSRECQKPKREKDTAYHKEKMILCKQEKARFQLNAEQAHWRDDTDDKPDDQELEAHYMYMAQIQEVTPYVADNFGPIFDTEPLQKVQNDDDKYNMFANDREHHVQPESINDTYLEEQRDTNITIEPFDMSTNGETVNQDDDDLAKERDLLASLIEKLKCEIDDSKNRYNFLESSNKTLVDKLKVVQCERLEKELSKSNITSKSFETLQQHAIDLELALQTTIPEQTTVETVLNMSPANKAHFESEKEAIHLILTGIGDEIYSTVDACKIAHEMWETSYRRLLQGESLTSKDFKTNLFWECLSIHLSAMEKQFESNFNFFSNFNQTGQVLVTIVQATTQVVTLPITSYLHFLKQYQKEVNELRAERIAKNANLLALVATAQPCQDPYYQTSKSHKSFSPNQ